MDFTPEVNKPEKLYCGAGEFTLGDTIIKCKYRKRCAGIKRFLEQQAKGETEHE
jgi:hypothetical protein